MNKNKKNNIKNKLGYVEIYYLIVILINIYLI